MVLLYLKFKILHTLVFGFLSCSCGFLVLGDLLRLSNLTCSHLDFLAKFLVFFSYYVFNMCGSFVVVGFFV